MEAAVLAATICASQRCGPVEGVHSRIQQKKRFLSSGEHWTDPRIFVKETAGEWWNFLLVLKSSCRYFNM
jgi:hypothetical protein